MTWFVLPVIRFQAFKYDFNYTQKTRTLGVDATRAMTPSSYGKVVTWSGYCAVTGGEKSRDVDTVL